MPLRPTDPIVKNYRSDAIGIPEERRGTMYDPFVANVFVAMRLSSDNSEGIPSESLYPLQLAVASPFL